MYGDAATSPQLKRGEGSSENIIEREVALAISPRIPPSRLHLSSFTAEARYNPTIASETEITHGGVYSVDQPR